MDLKHVFVSLTVSEAKHSAAVTVHSDPLVAFINYQIVMFYCWVLAGRLVVQYLIIFSSFLFFMV